MLHPWIIDSDRFSGDVLLGWLYLRGKGHFSATRVVLEWKYENNKYPSVGWHLIVFELLYKVKHLSMQSALTSICEQIGHLKELTEF